MPATIDQVSKNTFQQIQTSSKFARSGILNTRRGSVITPLFMPVATRAAVKGVDPVQVKNTGAQILLSNTYHLHLQPGEALIKKFGGLHQFNKWEGPILTDSGGFQVFSLAKVRKITEEGVEFKDPKTGDKVFISPEKSMQIQFALGSDIIMAFDDLTGLSLSDRHRTSEALERTHRWLERCVAEFKRLTVGMATNKRPLLFGISQGGLDKKLRARSLDFVQAQDVDGVAVGGLSVGESREEMHGMLEYLAALYDPTKVRYLMGVGDPIDLRFGLNHGIDMMDCVLPTRNARHGSVWVSGDQKLNLKNATFAADKSVIEQGCDCQACQTGYSRAFLRQLYKTDNPLAGTLASVHNLRYLQRICEQYRK
ncbi:MAG TPA: tRNA guanosine(34) transglycosylase Tgt [Candidatus Saccharimonadales bacterium]|nr:tRNA guanosine(34) transglycosylase Tgt [Candidatus Saccharimonadales bacterium]